MNEEKSLSRRGEQYVGCRLTLKTPIKNGVGKLKVDDTIWRIRGEDLAAGTIVNVKGFEGGALLVQRREIQYDYLESIDTRRMYRMGQNHVMVEVIDMGTMRSESGINTGDYDDLRKQRYMLLALSTDLSLNTKDYRTACKALNTTNEIIKDLKSGAKIGFFRYIYKFTMGYIFDLGYRDSR